MDSFADIEQDIDQHYRQAGGKLVASLLSSVTEDPQMDDRVQQVRRHATLPLRAPQPRPLKVRLLCGLVLWGTTAYCAPRQTLGENHEVWTEIRYLERHGSEDHLQYATFRRRGLPSGSGAIESTIRRVINQRLKSNAT